MTRSDTSAGSKSRLAMGGAHTDVVTPCSPLRLRRLIPGSQALGDLREAVPHVVPPSSGTRLPKPRSCANPRIHGCPTRCPPTCNRSFSAPLLSHQNRAPSKLGPGLTVAASAHPRISIRGNAGTTHSASQFSVRGCMSVHQLPLAQAFHVARGSRKVSSPQCQVDSFRSPSTYTHVETHEY